MYEHLRYLLLQVRNEDDPMRDHEVRCFMSVLRCDREQVRVVDLLREPPSLQQIQAADVALLGGSGDYSVVEGGDWLEPALDIMVELHAISKPTFASCWGFQAMSRAMAGTVVTDLERAEVGTHELRLTDAGRRDPVFGPLGDAFFGQMGHHDIVDTLPRDAVLLASSERVTNQAFRFEGRPIYCTQFHPELDLEHLLDRVRTYPRYVEAIAQMPVDEFIRTCRESPETGPLLRRFLDEIVLA
jgi:GMP synthase (glutamine-hydrolysing)